MKLETVIKPQPLLRTLPLLLAMLLGAGSALAQSAMQVEVYKSPYCGCCEKWVEHMQENGFKVNAHNVNDVPAARKTPGMETATPAPYATLLVQADGSTTVFAKH